jgi:hypothetical protein
MSTFEPAMTGKLTDRLRGKYPIGPMLPNGEPEFGYRQYDPAILPPIQIEAAEAIERMANHMRWVIKGIDDGRNDKEEPDYILAGLREEAAWAIREIGEDPPEEPDDAGEYEEEEE